jgi:hypothetical protein
LPAAEFQRLTGIVGEKFGFESVLECGGKHLQTQITPVCLHPLQVIVRSCTNDAFWQIRKNGKKIATIRLIMVHSFPAGNETYTLMRVTRASFQGVVFLTRLRFYLRHQKPAKLFAWNYYWKRAALFFTARPVWLVSASCGDFRSIFPMDLVFHDATNELFILGLRQSNRVNEFLQDGNLRISIAHAPANERDAIVAYGDSHFGKAYEMPQPHMLTATHQNVFPDFIRSYYEVTLSGSHVIGSQTLLFCNIIGVHADAKTEVMFHLHGAASV